MRALYRITAGPQAALVAVEVPGGTAPLHYIAGDFDWPARSGHEINFNRLPTPVQIAVTRHFEAVYRLPQDQRRAYVLGLPTLIVEV